MRNRDDIESNERTSEEAAGKDVASVTQRLERVAPILAELRRATRRSLDRDLSKVEPTFQFRPDGK